MLRRIFSTCLCVFISFSFAQDPVFGTGGDDDDNSYPNRWFSGARFNTGPFYHNDLHFFWEGDLFIPAFWSRNSMIFLDIRGIDYQGPSFEGNIGIGFRRLFSDRFIIGGYVFFDRKKTEFRNYFSQITIGAEWRTDKWTACVNGYIPIGSGTQTLSHNDKTVLTEPDIDSLRNVLFVNGMEIALYGLDVEVGRRFGDLSLYIGGYYFDRSDVRTVAGPRLRVTYSLVDLFGGKKHNWNDLLLEGAIHHDSPRGTQGYVGVRLFVYFGSTKGRKTTGVAARMLDYVRRDLDIVTLPNDNADFQTLCQPNGSPVQVQIATTAAELNQAIGQADVIGISGTIPVSTDLVLKDNQTVTGGMFYFSCGSNKTMGIQLGQNGTLVRDNSGTGGLFFVARNNSFRDLVLWPKATTTSSFGHAIQNNPATELSIGTLTIDNVYFFANAAVGDTGPNGVSLEIGDNSTDSVLNVTNSRFDGMRNGILALTKNNTKLTIASISNNQFLNIINSGVFVQGKGSVPLMVLGIWQNIFTSVRDSSVGIEVFDLVDISRIWYNKMVFNSNSSRGILMDFGSGDNHEINVNTINDNWITFGQGGTNNRCIFANADDTGTITLGSGGTVSNNWLQALNNLTISRGFSLVGIPGIVNVFVNAGGQDLREANNFFGLTPAEEVATAGIVNMVPPLN